MSQDLIRTDEYRDLIASLKNRVQAAQIKAAVTVNTQLIALYWDIGQKIAEKQRASGWGDWSHRADCQGPYPRTGRA
ncbi:MAG: hypothetical protein H6974_10715 [Gammaproteobacteria bacterium]|nr:hypothetical protein [Gammaproteobacteria bacterium]